MVKEKSDRLLERVESLVDRIEGIVPAPVAPIDWSISHAATWRQRPPLGGYLHPLSRTSDLKLGRHPVRRQAKSAAKREYATVSGRLTCQ